MWTIISGFARGRQSRSIWKRQETHMFNRFCFGTLLLACLALPFTGCSNASSGLDSIQVTPVSNSIAAGSTLQLTATGTFGNGSHPTKQDITSQASWTSASTGIAIVGPCTSGVTGCPTGGLAAGVVLAEASGTTTITATAQGYNGPVSSSVSVTVTSASGTNPTGPTGPVSSEGLVSLTIIPSSITVGNLQDTGNFIAIGTYTTTPVVRDVTNSAIWISSFPNVFPVDTNSGGNTGATAGIVTAYGSGTGATIIAEIVDPATQSIQYATATFACPLVLPCPCTVENGCNPAVVDCPGGPVAGSCFPGSQASALLSTVTVYNEGLNTTNWEITAPSATGTPNVIHCGPGWALNGGTGGSVCVATYPIGYAPVLTAPAGAGAFGGWSDNCMPNPNPPTAGGPNQCTVIIPPNTAPTNITVGAIFN
jgi:hypothetical protein